MTTRTPAGFIHGVDARPLQVWDERLVGRGGIRAGTGATGNHERGKRHAIYTCFHRLSFRNWRIGDILSPPRPKMPEEKDQIGLPPVSDAISSSPVKRKDVSSYKVLRPAIVMEIVDS